MEILLGLGLGVALAAACGFRVFVPLLVMSLGARSGHLHLASDFLWLRSDLATGALVVATVAEVLAYYVPFVDNLLDTVASPASVVAGTVVTAAAVGDMSPALQWSLAVIAGGGTAGVVQLGTVKARAASSVLTGGVANPVVSTAENGSSLLLAALAVLLPVAGLVAALGLGVLVYRRARA